MVVIVSFADRIHVHVFLCEVSVNEQEEEELSSGSSLFLLSILLDFFFFPQHTSEVHCMLMTDPLAGNRHQKAAGDSSP